ncbi:MAG: hypothetical protein D5S00_07250 [Tindallia sp. MSAO_Bac2]|nr:MAG: hypothetical protein D5S00_07250 [Tindallia sp. MSAO_Bac2]
MAGELLIRKRFISSCFFRSSKHFPMLSLFLIYFQGFYRVFDVVGKKGIEPGIAVEVFLDGFLVKEHFAATYWCFLDGKEGLVCVFMLSDQLAYLQLFLIAQQLFGKAVRRFGCGVRIIVKMYVATTPVFAPGI